MIFVGGGQRGRDRQLAPKCRSVVPGAGSTASRRLAPLGAPIQHSRWPTGVANRHSLRVAVGDEPTWLSELRANLGLVAEEGALAARLADVAEHIDGWRAGDQDAGLIAADSLDQLLGLLPDLVTTFDRLRVVLPAVLADLPDFPE